MVIPLSNQGGWSTQYTAVVALGEPDQHFNVVLDSGSAVRVTLLLCGLN